MRHEVIFWKAKIPPVPLKGRLRPEKLLGFIQHKSKRCFISPITNEAKMSDKRNCF
jgi:hypothetical protein